GLYNNIEVFRSLLQILNGHHRSTSDIDRCLTHYLVGDPSLFSCGGSRRSTSHIACRLSTLSARSAMESLHGLGGVLRCRNPREDPEYSGETISENVRLVCLNFH